MAGAVVLDLDRPASPADQAQTFTKFYEHVQGDVAVCNDAFGQAARMYAAARHGGAGDVAAAAHFARLAEVVCTAEGNTDLLALAMLPVPRSLAGEHLDQATTDLGLWAYPNAAASLLDMAALLEHPGDAGAAAGLRAGLAGMRGEAAAAEQLLGAAAARYGVPLTPMRLAPGE